MKRINSFFVIMVSALMMTMPSCMNEGGVGLIDQDSMVTTLSDQAVSVESSLETVVDVLNDLSQIGEKSKSSEIETLESRLAECVSGLKDHVAYLKSETSLADGTLATMAVQKQLAAAVGALETYMMMNTDVDFGNIGNDLKNLETSVQTWIGRNYEVYYSVAVADARMDYFVSRFGNKMLSQKYSVEGFLSDIEAGLRGKENYDELAELSASVGKNESEVSGLMLSISGMADQLEEECGMAIKAAATKSSDYDFTTLVKMNSTVSVAVRSAGTTLADLIERVAACEAALEDIKARLGVVEGKVEELLGLVQSLSFVSKYSSDVAVAYYKLDPDHVDGEGRQARVPVANFELNYIVRPAAAVTALADMGAWAANGVDLKIKGYFADVIDVKSFENDFFDFTINDVAGDPETGVLTVNVASTGLTDAFFMKQTGAKVAMSLKAGKTDVSSRFVEIVPKDQSGKVYVENMTLSATTIDLNKGDTAELTATLTPAGLTVGGCDYVSSAPDIAAVDAEGTITAKAVGSADITVTTKGTNEWGQKLTATCRVNVVPSVRIVKTRSWIEVGEEANFTLQVSDSFKYTGIKWRTSNSYASVDQNGVVTGKSYEFDETTGSGGALLSRSYYKTTVYCDIYNGGAEPETTLVDEITVVAKQPRGVEIPNAPSDEITLKKGMSLNLGTPSILPADVNDGLRDDMKFSMTYVNMDLQRTYIDFSNNVVTGKEIGSGTIQFSVSGAKGLYAPDHYVVRNLNINVIPIYVTGLKLTSAGVDITNSYIEVAAGGNTSAVVEFTSDEDGYDPSDTKVVWSSSNPSVATVDENGNISVREGSGGGNTTITVKTAGDNSVPAGEAHKSASFTLISTAPWKSFNVGEYVLNDNGTIAFATAADIQSDESLKSKVVGIVFAKKNPRVTDVLLPETCTHGLAVALNNAKNGTYSDMAWNYQNSESLSAWATENEYQSLSDDSRMLGYNNTKVLEAKYSSDSNCEIIQGLKKYSSSVALPNDVSPWYIPSIAELIVLADVRSTLDFVSVGGSDFSQSSATSNALHKGLYWSSSEASAAPTSNAVPYNVYSDTYYGYLLLKNQRIFMRPIFAF